MSDFQELLAVDSNTALNFFLTSLKDEVSENRVEYDEMLYVASVLAHYARTSCCDPLWMPCPATLLDIFDNFIWRGQSIKDSELLESAGTQTLLLAGFFRDQMRKRHNVEWYDQVGQLFYDRAERHSKDKEKQELFGRMSNSFPIWTKTCNKMSRTLRKNQHLLRI